MPAFAYSCFLIKLKFHCLEQSNLSHILVSVASPNVSGIIANSCKATLSAVIKSRVGKSLCVVHQDVLLNTFPKVATHRAIFQTLPQTDSLNQQLYFCFASVMSQTGLAGS